MKTANIATSLSLALACWLSVTPTAVSQGQASSAATSKQQSREIAPQESSAPKPDPVSGAALQISQKELLELAYAAACKFPLNPHVKNRARAQESILDACFELQQGELAKTFAERITNWRRGLAYANYAFFRAEHGQTEVQPLLEEALAISEASEDWRKDRIRVRIASTWALMGNTERAQLLEAGIDPSESGKVRAIFARQVEQEKLEQELNELSIFIDQGNLDQIRNALEGVLTLYERFYQDTEERALLETTLQRIQKKMPRSLAIETGTRAAAICFEQGDLTEAQAWLHSAAALLAESTWLSPDQIQLSALIAGHRGRAGETAAARKMLDTCLAEYAENREEIPNFDRAGILRPIAEAYALIGEAEDLRAAMGVYRQALDEGVENPNARPRTNDLVATCCSMALNGLEPNETVWTQLRQISAGLRDPW